MPRGIHPAIGRGEVLDLGRLLGNVFAANDRVRWIAVLEAYADRSYAPPLQLYAVASFLAPANDWARLQIRWRRILRAADPKLEFFHMVDFMSKKVSPYCDWDDEKREWVLNELIRAVRRRRRPAALSLRRRARACKGQECEPHHGGDRFGVR